jgi:4-hydroxy-tetrahydrodipicolinate synthase
MSRTIFQGAGTALITPMKADFSVNEDKLVQLIHYQIDHHADALVIAGTTGEGSTLTTEEYQTVLLRTVKETGGRIPVIAGAGSNNTAHAVELSKLAEDCGADGLLHITPYYNKTSQKGLVAHFSACAKATNLPIILYNIPSRTGVNIKPETYLELCSLDQIVGVKEASGDFSQLAQIKALCKDRLDLYSGNDDQIVAVMSLGGKGVISVLSNLLPQAVHDICQSFLDGDIKKSRMLQLNYLKLINALFWDINPVPVKQAMNQMGIDVGPCRMPLWEMEQETLLRLQKLLQEYQLV